MVAVVGKRTYLSFLFLVIPHQSTDTIIHRLYWQLLNAQPPSSANPTIEAVEQQITHIEHRIRRTQDEISHVIHDAAQSQEIEKLDLSQLHRANPSSNHEDYHGLDQDHEYEQHHNKRNIRDLYLRAIKEKLQRHVQHSVKQLDTMINQVTPNITYPFLHEAEARAYKELLDRQTQETAVKQHDHLKLQMAQYSQEELEKKLEKRQLMVEDEDKKLKIEAEERIKNLQIQMQAQELADLKKEKIEHDREREESWKEFQGREQRIKMREVDAQLDAQRYMTIHQQNQEQVKLVEAS